MDDITTEIVRDGGVDFGRLDKDRAHELSAELFDAKLPSLKVARFAFLINAYNLSVLGLAKRFLAKDGKTRSLRNPINWLLFFLIFRVKVAGEKLSLAKLEKRRLGPFLARDPRGHFALNCASSGCPPLRKGLYSAESLDDELDAASRIALAQGVGYQLDRAAGELRVTKLFKWYKSDFEMLGGPVGAIRKYGDADDAEWLRTHKVRVKFLPYDWSLNAL